MKHQVVVRKYDDDDYEELIGEPTTERRADKIEDGLNINLDHSRYYTEIVSIAEKGDAEK